MSDFYDADAYYDTYDQDLQQALDEGDDDALQQVLARDPTWEDHQTAQAAHLDAAYSADLAAAGEVVDELAQEVGRRHGLQSEANQQEILLAAEHVYNNLEQQLRHAGVSEAEFQRYVPQLVQRAIDEGGEYVRDFHIRQRGLRIARGGR
jgi:hypothetical protein